MWIWYCAVLYLGEKCRFEGLARGCYPLVDMLLRLSKSRHPGQAHPGPWHSYCRLSTTPIRFALWFDKVCEFAHLFTLSGALTNRVTYRVVSTRHSWPRHVAISLFLFLNRGCDCSKENHPTIGSGLQWPYIVGDGDGGGEHRGAHQAEDDVIIPRPRGTIL